jgi:hypothetical protein
LTIDQIGVADEFAEVSHEYHFFISHASEDKDAIARPLYEELKSRGYKVWSDEAVLVVGKSLVESIDPGLANCDHGIIILSPAFFAKSWPARHLARTESPRDQ